MTTIRTSNNPAMLKWARDEVGYSLEQASAAIGISIGILQKAEAGDHQLTLNQLRTTAVKYNCPFGYFYFKDLPHKTTFKSVPDFRLDPAFIGVNHYRLFLEIKKARDQRLVFLELAKTLENPVKKFQALKETNISAAAKLVRRRLNVTEAEIASLKFEQSYSYWKSKIEQDGVLVYESQYLPEESGVIGVAIYYSESPIILIKRGGRNNARKLFTLLHEYAHLLKGSSAMTDEWGLTSDSNNSKIENVEVACNRLAAEILVPTEKVILSDFVQLEPAQQMESLAYLFKVTFSTAAVCLKRLGLVDQNTLTELLELRNQANQKPKKQKSGGVRIPREVLMRLDLGRPMFNVVMQAYSSGVLDVFDASKILNLRVKKIDTLLAGTGR
jgi:Zn-dependent peptidase ImmA (M78 family)/transcriptional regulator with XRE-family HTH domain